MKKSELSRYLDTLESGVSLEIRKDGIDSYSINKQMESIPTAKYPTSSFRSTSFVEVHSQGFSHYTEFGKKLSSRDNSKDYDVLVLKGIFESFVDLSGKFDNFQDSTGLKYKVFTVNNIKGFYNKSGNLSFIEFMGKRLYIPQKSPKLNTKIFKDLESVK